MRIVNDETGVDIPPEWMVRYYKDLGNYRRAIREAREKNFKCLRIKS